MKIISNPMAQSRSSVGNPIGKLPAPVSRAKFTAPPPQTNAPGVKGASQVVAEPAKITPQAASSGDAWLAAHKGQ